jgi:O-antigen ligase
MAMIIWGAIAAAVNFYVFFSYYGTLEYFCKGIGINTNGRLRMYSRVAEWFDNELLVFGQGLGVVEKLLENWNIPAFLNLHNDLLKFYVELGAVGLLVYLFSYGVVIWLTGKRIGKPQMSFLVAMFAYSMALFATDNVSIYIMYTMPFYTMCFAGLSLGENPERMNGKADKSCQ